MNNEEELFETCIELRRRVNELEDKIQEILNDNFNKREKSRATGI